MAGHRLKAGDNGPMPVDHYENFPVASIACPPALRAPIAAIYHFARTADDLADEGDASADQRLADLAAYRADLTAVAQGQPPSARWAPVFAALARALASHALPVPLLFDLLDAFSQDVRKTRDGEGYANWAELLDYCRRSANPVGRLLLHLYGVHGDEALAQSDRICSALQIINFLQDLSVDLPRGRFYLPQERCAFHGLTRADLLKGEVTPAVRALVGETVTWCRYSMAHGAPLATHVRGRAGWELRLVVQGGQRILDKVAALDGATLHTRPTLGKADLPVMLWRSLWM